MRPTALKSKATYWALGAHSFLYALFKHYPFNRRKSELLAGEDCVDLLQASPHLRSLLGNFTRQFNPSSCSVASVATVLNAARQHLGIDGSQEAITQHRILDEVDTVHWKARVSREGHNGRRGLPLALLREAVECALVRFQIPYAAVTAVPVVLRNERHQKKDLLNRLAAMVRLEDSYIIAHFNQGVFVKSLHLPHISPVGAFDSRHRRVLILDVDPDQRAPYWVSFNTFYAGMASDFHGILRHYGYSSGGYVWIKLKPGP